jgi:thioredoxin 1
MPSRHDPFISVSSDADLRLRIGQEAALLAYFSTPECNVCKVIKPKLGALLEAEFPRIARVYVDCAAHPQAAAQFGVFAVPTLVVFFDGRESLRKGRSFGLEALRNELRRPYSLMFGELSA